MGRLDFGRRLQAYDASVIESDVGAVGGLFVESTSACIDIVELQVVPEYQGIGIGTSVVQGVVDEGQRRGIPVTLSVVLANARAKQLYERLGFEVTGFEAPFIRMRHHPRSTAV